MENKSLTAAQLALYLGCKVIIAGIEYNLAQVSVTGTCCVYCKEDGIGYFDASAIRPILRRLSSLTEAEAERIYEIRTGRSFVRRPEWLDDGTEDLSALKDAKELVEIYDEELTLMIGSPAVWQYLLSIGIDLFGWIDAGLAVDAQTLNNAGN